MGITEHGVYLDEHDEFAHVPPNELHLGLEVDEDYGEETSSSSDASSDSDSSSGSDSSSNSDSDESSLDNEHTEIQEAARVNSNTPAVRVPRIESPFDDPDVEQQFLHCLNAARAGDSVPDGYGLKEGEAGYDDYDPVESIGRVGKVTDAQVVLSASIWRPRIVEWVQAIEGLEMFLAGGM